MEFVDKNEYFLTLPERAFGQPYACNIVLLLGDPGTQRWLQLHANTGDWLGRVARPSSL